MSEINTWPGWECACKLGKGAFGNVYEIKRIESGKIYRAALKVITVPQDQSEVQNAYSEGMTEENVTTYFESVVNDFTKEFALMDELKGYTNIVSYEDHMVVKHENGIGWDILIRMELLTPLLKWIDEYPMDEKMVIKLGCDICTALELCHKNNIIHRDIKPENIFVNKNGDFKLGDFGIARVTEKTSSVMSQKGTGPYMAPEVDKGEKYNETVDIYSLGIVLYRFLNNHRTPFLPMGQITHYDRKMALDKRLSGEPIPAPMNGSDKLKKIVLKAIQYDPSKRFQNAKALKKALENLNDDRDDITKDIHGYKEDNNITEDKTQKMKNSRENDFQEEEEDITIRKKHAVIPQKKKKKWMFPTIMLGGIFLIAVTAFFLLNPIDKNAMQTNMSTGLDKQEQKEIVVSEDKQVEQHSEELDDVEVDLNYAKAVAEFLIANITGFSSDEMQFYLDLGDDELQTILNEKEIPINAAALKTIFSHYLKTSDTLGKYVSTGNHKFKKYEIGAKHFVEIDFSNYSAMLAISFNNEGVVTSGSFQKKQKKETQNTDVSVEASNEKSEVTKAGKIIELNHLASWHVNYSAASDVDSCVELIKDNQMLLVQGEDVYLFGLPHLVTYWTEFGWDAESDDDNEEMINPGYAGWAYITKDENVLFLMVYNDSTYAKMAKDCTVVGIILEEKNGQYMRLKDGVDSKTIMEQGVSIHGDIEKECFAWGDKSNLQVLKTNSETVVMFVEPDFLDEFGIIKLWEIY